ncbi:RAD51-associated protein 1 [Nothobranchius furzeri]|uniref:RAD51 associated protein 1 n=1 Tax=Nothobranchius furzeri TaxID=105023 RepID=A0A1A8A5H6_NOTFU|nr:RAD51 associated protein 1 [Nothobranchius furzeri]
MERPSRKTKAVNYSESNDFDDDEDFASVKAPPSKKHKEDMRQEQKKSSTKSVSQESDSKSTESEKSRKPLDEKLYERDLEAAITLSLLNNAEGIKEAPTSKDLRAKNPIDENTDPFSLPISNCSVDGAVMGLNKITSEKGSPVSAKRRKASAKAAEVQRKTNEDEDYQPKLTPGSESDEDYSEPAESEDEEFTVKKASKTKKREKGTKKDKIKLTPASRKQKQPSKPSNPKLQTSAATSVRSPPAAKPRPASSKPAASLSPAGGRIPKWNPPAQIGKSPTSSSAPAVKSPGQGLRLGLSRLVRVKPLHPSVAGH